VLSLTVSAGATLRTSLAAAAERVGPPLGPALVGVRRQLESGATVTEALNRLSVGLAAEHRVVIERIRSAELTGAPLGSLLRTSAQSLAERRRRDAEVRARRLPVFMVLPLVCCVLPAFVVLAIVPMVVSGGSSLFPL
jgi:tight adherence protein C